MSPTSSLLLGLQFREELPTRVVDELDQLTGSIQVSFNALRDNLAQQNLLHCVAFHSTTQALTTAVPTQLLLDSHDTDPSGMLSSNVARIQVSGFYLIIGCAAFEPSGAGAVRYIEILKNGTALKYSTASPIAGLYTHVSLPDVAQLVAGDAIGLVGYQDSGGTVNVGHVSRFAQTQLAVAKLF